MSHTFHIPVLGLGYSIDTPLKVARFGISSVVSIVDDELTERMRKHHSEINGIAYKAIGLKEADSRARRITAYLNLVQDLVDQQVKAMKQMEFIPGNDLYKYFEMLPPESKLKGTFNNMLALRDGKIKSIIAEVLKNEIKPGNIDVNIMSKVDKANYTADDEYAGDDFTDALAAMRGFAESKLRSSVIISAGLNPRLYAYMEKCSDFYPTVALKKSANRNKSVVSNNEQAFDSATLGTNADAVSSNREPVLDAAAFIKPLVSANNSPCEESALEEATFSSEIINIAAELKSHQAPTKKIILKVSDYRSAIIQAKMLAKRGLWVSEFRVESGLNCGGHAFATDGLLMGPILEEFKQNRESLKEEIYKIFHNALEQKGLPLPETLPEQAITYQGGIGTAEEHQFLIKHYGLDAAGWGSPFLLVPEATNVDNNTLESLITAEEKDFYISNASPLGVLFNNFKHSTAETLRLERIAKGRPGSPCKKKYLCTNTEFTEKPICTASRAYQNLKIEQIKSLGMAASETQTHIDAITEKVCLCEGLCASVYLKNGLLKPRESDAVSICPGPNLAYFSGKYSLKEMIDHIYGKIDLLKNATRPNLFINELRLYIDYLKKDMETQLVAVNDKKAKYWNKFSEQLQQGINYYKGLIPQLIEGQKLLVTQMEQDIAQAEQDLLGLLQPTVCN